MERASFQGRSSFRTWVYRIATNTCLNALRRRPRRLVPQELGPAADPEIDAAPPAELAWLQPYPDRLLDEAGPEAAAVSRETIELAFLAAIQHLPPRQRAVLILREALDWPAADVASLLDSSVASVNSTLQRARSTLKQHLPERRGEWGGMPDPGEERSLLERYMDAWDRADVAGLASLLREDARMTMPPTPSWYGGRQAIAKFFERNVFARERGAYRLVSTRANRQPALAVSLRRPGESAHLALALKVLRIEGGQVASIEGFVYPELFTAFGLAASL